jgi:hypothetical protein
MVEQVAVALIGLLGAGVTGVLAHRPQAAAVHIGMDAARERVLARLAQPLIEVGRQVGFGVDRLDLDT